MRTRKPARVGTGRSNLRRDGRGFTLDPPGLNVGFSDGHAEQISDNAGFAYAHLALPTYGSNDRFVRFFWEYLDGDPRGLEKFYNLPPELLR